jgi:lipoprotein NlpD
MKLSSQFLLLLAIFVASCSSRHTPAPVVSVYGGTPLSERAKSSINGTQYIVKKGETLYSIAWRANSDVRKLAKLNKLSPPYHIYPGQKLIVTGKSVAKVPKATSSRRYVKNSNKSSTTTTKNIIKKPIAPKKKQEYGKNVSEQKVSKKATSNATPFSKKIKKWQWPASGKVIATFSTAQQGNKGIDIAGHRGKKVRAAANGKVVYAGSALRGYGKLIIVKHNDDYLSAYAHNDKILVKEQQLIKAGNIIATMGDTGAQRVMLHFEVRFRGKSVNPLKYLPKK